MCPYLFAAARTHAELSTARLRELMRRPENEGDRVAHVLRGISVKQA